MLDYVNAARNILLRDIKLKKKKPQRTKVKTRVLLSGASLANAHLLHFS